MNEKKYPAPWNQLDALARAYADQGDNERAIRFYRRLTEGESQERLGDAEATGDGRGRFECQAE